MQLSCYQAAALAVMWLFITRWYVATHLHYLNVAILGTIQLLLATMWLFLLPCSYSCHHVVIFAAMQPLIVAMWLFLLPCSYSCNVAILAAMQLFLPQWGYSCCHAANLATMWLFLLPCSCNPCHMCGFTCFYSFRLHHLVVLVSRPFLLSCC